MNDQRGVSLVESLLVVVIVAGIVFLMANLPNAMGLINKSKNLGLAREIASKQIEDKRNTNFLNLVNDTISLTSNVDSRMTLLPSSSGEIKVEDCPSEICPNGEQLKQITIVVNWMENQKPQTINIQTLIGEGGLNQ